MTDIPTIAALPLPPQRGQDPAIFIERADVFIDALADFVAQLNAFGAQLIAATQERVVDQAADSYAGAVAARDVAIAARNAAQAYADSLDANNIVHRTGNETINGTKNFADVIQLAGAALTLAATYPEASTAEMRANIASRLVSVRASWNALVPAALPDAATIAVDLATGVNFAVTIAGNRVLGSPTNGKPGQQGSIFVTQGGAGGFLLSFAAAYVPDDLITYPLLNMDAGTVTELRYKVAADGKVRLYGGKPAPVGYALSEFFGGQPTATATYRIMIGAPGRLVAENCTMYSAGQTPSLSIYNVVRTRGGSTTVIGTLTFTAGNRAGVFAFSNPSVIMNDFISFALANAPGAAAADCYTILFVTTN